jgi:hypothetical protein
MRITIVQELLQRHKMENENSIPLKPDAEVLFSGFNQRSVILIGLYGELITFVVPTNTLY